MRRFVVLVLAIALAGCASTTTLPGPPLTGNPAANWIFTKAALDAITANPQARARLSGARIFEILKGNEKPSTAMPVVPTISFKSVATLQDAVDSGRLRRDVRAVIYDSEHWPQTPVDEQRDPAGSYQQAAAVAHAHGLIFVATPAMDLVNATGGRATNPAQAFLARGIDGSTAKYADVVDIQAQSLERDPAAYRDFVTRAADQIRRANPAAAVLAGLSTNPHGTAITADMLVSDMTAVSGAVSGFWLNIPDQGCTDCATARPDVAVGALTDGRLAALDKLFAR